MEDNNVRVCDQCQTPLVPSKQELRMDGSVAMDGTSNFGGMICPKCHPELAKQTK